MYSEDSSENKEAGGRGQEGTLQEGLKESGAGIGLR